MPKETNTLITKAEAAGALGLSERAVARHAEAGRLTPIYQPKADGGQRVYYGAAEVERLRVALTQPHPRYTLARRDTVLPGVQASASDLATGEPVSEIRHKRALTVAEAAGYSGLGRGTIERAINEGRLLALPVGRRGARVVRRADIEALVEATFDAAQQAKRARRDG